MIKLDGLTPNFKQNVLISVNSLIDIDIGLFFLIKDEYLDPSVFSVDYFEKSNIIDFIKTGDIMLTDNLIKSLCTIAVIAVLEMLYSIYEKRSNNN